LKDSVCSYILEDYNKGVLCVETIRMVTDMAGLSDKPVAVDPKVINFWNYGGCTLFKPNRHEAGTALGMEISDIDQASEAASLICRKLPADNVLITLGSMGSVLYQGASGRSRHIPTVARHVFDVSGAGDSVIAVMGLAQGCGMDMYDAARLANLAAAAVCVEPGVYAVRPDDIIREAERVEHGS
jgi:D-beta-D-heptose 7-phosphate kinase/D-beta-D-heptose 1-phosphate adenosyltransferase